MRQFMELLLFVVGKNLNAQLKAAHISGWFQFGLAMIVLVDVLRRFIYGSEPVSILMIFNWWFSACSQC